MTVTLRDVAPGDAAALAHVLVTANEHAYRGVVPDQCLNFTEAESAANWKRPLTDGLAAGEFMLIAETAGPAVVAYAWGSAHAMDARFDGQLKQLNVLPEHQGRGLGRLLVGHVATRLAREHGARSMCVETLHCNPNRPFYERLGAVFVSRRDFDWDGVVLPMCLYGWTDLDPLLRR